MSTTLPIQCGLQHNKPHTSMYTLAGYQLKHGLHFLLRYVNEGICFVTTNNDIITDIQHVHVQSVITTPCTCVPHRTVLPTQPQCVCAYQMQANTIT